MKNKYQMITKRQGNRIFILESFSAAALFLPQLVLKENKGSAVLSVIAACIFIGIYFWIAAKTAKGISMENVLKEHPWAAVFYYIRFFINGAFYYIYIISMVSRYLLPGRKGFFVGLPLLFLAWSVNKTGLRERGRVMEGIFWFVLIPVIFVLLLSASDLAFRELAVTEFGWKDFGKGTLLLAALFHPVEFVWFYRGDMEHGNMKFTSFLGLAILLLGVYCATAGSLGRTLTVYDENPVMSMAQGVAMPGGLMARLDIFLIAFWIVGVFCVFSGYLFYGNESLKHAFGKGRKAGVLLSYGGLLLLTNWLLPLYDFFWNNFSYFLYGNLLIGLVLPLTLFLMMQRRVQSENNA